MNVLFLTVVEALVNVLGHCAVVFPYIGYVECRTTLGEVELAISAHKLLAFVLIAFSYREHFRKVERVAAETDYLVLDKRGS